MNGPFSRGGADEVNLGLSLPRTAALWVSVLGVYASCAKVVSLPTGPITISGVVNDAAGLPLANKTVRLSRGLKYVEATTDAKGAYVFASLAPGSYTVRPRLEHCTFLPEKGDLDKLTTNTVQNFGGFGPACGGEPTVNMGAMTGALTVSGHIRDSAGRAIVGARVDLDDDDSRGIRFTDLTGGYAFHVRSRGVQAVGVGSVYLHACRQSEERRQGEPGAGLRGGQRLRDRVSVECDSHRVRSDN